MRTQLFLNIHKYAKIENIITSCYDPDKANHHKDFAEDNFAVVHRRSPTDTDYRRQVCAVYSFSGRATIGRDRLTAHS